MAGDDAGRDQWGRQIEFILTMVGYAVGLGNVWRFPYLCYQNGGGAFLVPYVICLVLLGIPMFALECAFGQFGGKGPLSIWSINPAFKGLGLTMVLAAAVVFIYYDIIIAWGLRFLVASFTADLPWIDCKGCECLLYETKNITIPQMELMKFNNSLGVHCPDLDPNDTLSPSELYYKNEVLRDSGTIEDLGEVQWPLLLANFVSYAIIFLVLYKGIQSLGKVVYFTATFPYLLLTILLVRSVMLEGSMTGIKYYLTPRWERLLDAKVWSDAAVQIFFSLSACIGGLIAMSSYNKFNNNIVRDAFLIPVINCCTSFYAGFVVFSTLGYMSEIKGVDIGKVTKPGPGLAFVVYPEAIGKMPLPTLWAVMFFFMLCILGFSTQFSAAETIMTSFIDEFPSVFRGKKSRTVAFRIFVCLLAFVLGIPMVTEGGSHLLNLVDEAVLGYPLLFIGLLEYFVVIHLYGYSNFAEDMRTMLGRKPMFYFKATWVVVSPVLLLAVIIFKAYNGIEFEVPWAEALYYIIVVFILMWVPIGFFYNTCPRGLWQLMKPEQAWKDRRALGDAAKLDMERMNTTIKHISETVEAANKGDGVWSYQNECKLYPAVDSKTEVTLENRGDRGVANASFVDDESRQKSSENL